MYNSNKPGDPNLPIATILGARSITMAALDVLSLLGSGVLSSCATSYGLNYTWSLADSTGQAVQYKSPSTNPATYLAKAYTLTAGMSYTATLQITALTTGFQHASTGYASVGIYVNHGKVVAAVRGGYTRQVEWHSHLTMQHCVTSVILHACNVTVSLSIFTL